MQQKTERRRLWLEDMCASLSEGEFVSARMFEDRLLEEENAKPVKIPRILKALVELHNEEPGGEGTFKLEFVPSKGVKRSSEFHLDQFRERRGKSAATKEVLTHVLLQWLFDMPSIEQEQGKPKKGNIENFPGSKHSFNHNWSDSSFIQYRLETKRRQMRSRTVLSVLVDAGTTTYKWTSQLIEADLPLRIASHGGGHYLLQPSIVTNSLAIAAKLAPHRNRRKIELTVLGGRERQERRSLVGSMALAWARNIKMNSKMDLAIMGTTGIDCLDGGTYSFFMDHSEEAVLKSELLQVANFRILVCDSSKILSGSCFHRVSGVSSECVDLIVIDDGSQLKEPGAGTHEFSAKEVNDEIEQFMRVAREAGVGVIMVQGRKPLAPLIQ